MMTKKVDKRKNPEPSIRAKRAIKLILENPGSIGEAMRKAGYSPNTAKNPKDLTESKAFKAAAVPIINQLENEIQRAIVSLPDKIDKAGYGEAVGGIEKMQKLVELLGGRETERSGWNINVVSYDESDDSI